MNQQDNGRVSGNNDDYDDRDIDYDVNVNKQLLVAMNCGGL